MPDISLKQFKQLPHSELSKIINEIRQRLSQNDVVKDMFKKYDVSLNELDYVPIKFADLEVSARTAHGVIYLNWKLLEDGNLDALDHYVVHELTHYLQQTTGDGPTQGSNDDDYLDNEFEQEGFQNQTEYLSDTRNDQVAEQYLEKVLDHHELSGKERSEKRKELLRAAAKKPKQLSLNFPQRLFTKEEIDQFLEDLGEEKVQPWRHKRDHQKLGPKEQEDRISYLQQLLNSLPKD